jgi:uncharacterized membrane protein
MNKIPLVAGGRIVAYRIIVDKLMKDEPTNASDKSDNQNTAKHALQHNNLAAKVQWALLRLKVINIDILVYLFLGFGWVLVATAYFSSAVATSIGILGIVGADANISNGIGAFLIALGGCLLGFGLILPLFYFAQEFLTRFLVVQKDVLGKLNKFRATVMQNVQVHI